MSRIEFQLFGRFSVQQDGQPLVGLDAQKTQELLCYLLIFRGRFHHREKLADLLWENSSKSQSRQYLRRCLWQLQAAVENDQVEDTSLIFIDSDWVQINNNARYWSDITELETAFNQAKGIRGHDLDQPKANALHDAVQLYKGDLLENWYQDWCILERERFQNLYLVMLDKLMGYCETHQEYERGILYGLQTLQCDVARERTYRRLIRLRYLAGDRTGALRQYHRCVAALQQELGVKPSPHTTAIYEQIKTQQPFSLDPHTTKTQIATKRFPELLYQLEHTRMTLIRVQQQIEQEMEVLKRTF